MAKKTTEKELLALYRARKHDQRQATTRRRIAITNLPKRMDEVLALYFKGDGEALKKIEESRALAAWETYVGAAAMRVSRALKIRNDTLVVKVIDPLWMQQLSLLKPELLRKFAKDFPKLRIRDIYFTRYA